MKTIIRRASHLGYNYRTTDADGAVALWFDKPVYIRHRGLWLGDGSAGMLAFDSTVPPANASNAIVRIGKVAK